MQENIIEYIKKHPYSKIPQLCAFYDGRKNDLMMILDQLVSDGDLILSDDSYVAPHTLHLIKGTVVAVKSHFAFISVEDSDDDVMVESVHLGNALLNDIVYLKHENKMYYKVTKIVKRSRTSVVGETKKLQKLTYLIVKAIATDDIIFVVDDYDDNDGSILRCEIMNYDDHVVHLRTIEKLGDKNAPGVDITRILLEHDCPLEFSDDVYAQVNEIPLDIEQDDIKNRRDFRDDLIVTIDGDDAKDLDDAVSAKCTEEGYRVGIHIADVSHYVTQYSPLDKEALNRGTSIYVTDRVVPMLPFALSNGICSLNEGVDRFTLSCIVDLDKEGHTLRSAIVPSVIRSQGRLTYRYVNDVIAKQKNDSDINKMLLVLDEIARLLRRQKEKRGCLNLSVGELKVIVDSEGHPVKLEKKYQQDGEKLIEDLMILANETVAETIEKSHLPFIYRIHENPPAKRVDNLMAFISRLGYRSPFNALNINPLLVQQLLKTAQGHDNETILSQVLLRSLAKARYATNNKGHFGLASTCYTHFTSPIRRYPDLTVHRLLRKYIFENDVQKAHLLQDELNYIAENSSLKERRAISVEREATDMKCAEYMAQFIGEPFSGFISGMNNSGLYVELDNGASGKINFNDMSDYYVIDALAQHCVGRRKGRHFMLGDKVDVTVFSTNKETGDINLTLNSEKKVSSFRRDTHKGKKTSKPRSRTYRR